jgi:diguanylate cyclase (GGDEF)-like protein/PAS domain S-box-containing protein
MPKKSTDRKQEQLVAENKDLRARLTEAEETLSAIRKAEVDAFIVTTNQGEQLFTLTGAEHSYRVLVEQMGEGALTLSLDGVILYCNRRFAEMVGILIEHVIGGNIRTFVSPSDNVALDAALESKTHTRQEIECILTTGAGTKMPARLTLVFLPLETPPVFCLTTVDLTETKRREMELVQARENLEERVAERTTELQREIAERKQMETKLKELSIHDALTGLYNRGFFAEEMARLGRGRQFPVSIVMADLNGMKKTNDVDGHAAGDLLLQRTAQVLNVAFRADDIVARFGGDEFAILLPYTDSASAQQLLCRVRGALDKYNTAHGGMPLSIAFGVSTAEQGGTLTNTLKEADTRMYEEKRGS